MIKNSLRNKVIITAILILTFAIILSLITGGVEAKGSNKILPNGPGSNGVVEESDYKTIEELKSGAMVTFGAWSYNENVFCVQHGQTFAPGSGVLYKVKDCYKIESTDILKNEQSIRPSDDLIACAQGIAYILQLDNKWASDKGTENEGKNCGEAQRILWAYLYNMTSNENAKKLGMYRGEAFSRSELTDSEKAYYDKAVEICNGTSDANYSAKYYIFEKANNPSTTQRLIILEYADKTEKKDDLQISINKVDATDNSKLQGAQFTVQFQQLNYLIYTTVHEEPITTDENGFASTGIISDIDTSKKLRVVIKETVAPKKYKKLKEEIKFDLKYNGTAWVLDGSIPNLDGFVTGTVNNSKVALTISNQVMNSISLNLLKESSNGDLTDGTEFKFDFTNISDFKVYGKYLGSLFVQDNLYTVKKNSDSKWIAEELDLEIKALIVKDRAILINEINFEDSNAEADITIEETKAPDNHGTIKTPIKIKVKLDDDKAIITESTAKTDEIKEIKVDNDNKFQINVKLMNYALINIRGTVWLDGQIGSKTGEAPNGRYDNTERGLAGIKVYLYKDTEKIKEYETKDDGTYEFRDIKCQEGLYVVFEYDGMNYIETVGSGYSKRTGEVDSDAEEIARDNFNKKFSMILSDGAYSFGDTGFNKTELEYNEEDTNTSILQTKENDGSVKDKFKMFAKTKKIEYSNETIELNCGLLKREFDLDLTTNLDYVEVKINGKTTDYKYSIDSDGNVLVQNTNQGVKDVTYNQYIYESDYNYDITDYKVGTQVDFADTVVDKVSEDDLQKVTTDELAVIVTYKVNLYNQIVPKGNVSVNQITYYYPKEFTPVGEILNPIGEIEIGEVTYNKAIIQGEYNLHNQTNSLEVKFSIEKDKLIEIIDKNLINYAEISAYATDEGFIDMNSKPGNCLNDNGTIRYEDDTDKTGTLKINWTNNERTLTGVVWEDTNENGVFDEDEEDNTIDGVTVQLIELREVSGITLEYIWQETVTGSSEVKRISLDGTRIETVADNGVTEGTGKYKFTGYIPGNYIIRYKYGTGGGSYDGNAYKSTYDRTGETRYLGNVELDVTETTRYSDAYDNEARRLGEMSIFAGETITKDSISDLQEHWMCADTNKFAAQIANKDNLVTDGVQIVDNIKKEYTEDYNLSEIDFGIMKRPETEISLEKHLTALSIDVAGEGKILDATFNLEEYLADKSNNKLNNLTAYISGNATNLTPIYSTRGERGFWKVETDVNELMNGAELSAEYTYVVSNNTRDADYLTKQLVEAYEKLSSGFTCKFKFEENQDVEITLMPGKGEGLYTYQSLLKDLESRTKTMIRKGSHTNGYYIGEFYYTGDKEKASASETEKPVTVQVNKIEELLNNEFVFDEGINYSSYGDDKNYSSAYTSTSQEKLIDYQHIEYDADGNKVINEGKAISEYQVYDKEGNPKDVYIAIKKEEGKEIATITANGQGGYTIVQSRAGNKYLEPISAKSDINTRVDIARKIVLTKTLNTSNINNLKFDSYNAEILSYSVASGRRSTSSTPGNLKYSYSADTDMTLDNCYYVESTKKTYKPVKEKTDTYFCLNDRTEISKEDLLNSGAMKLNETDEFWGETIIITSPTGEDGISTTLWIILGATCALIIAGGIFGIKKFVLKH